MIRFAKFTDYMILHFNSIKIHRFISYANKRGQGEQSVLLNN